eukprot:TRINITY_DN385_c0_g1_i1.p1 TRINITY_DN385_c0_g1~~TRINITY_DN385_c0_g1_i1.p1  ORF type:complete len:291 (+),score=191.48 TRINITY_DN385_c0_g1_i1:78-950(+)
MTQTEFYQAQENGSVDIGNSYGGTGVGENTTLTRDLFHQHGDIQVMQSWETPYMHQLAVALVAGVAKNAAVLMEAHGKITLLEIGFGLGLSATKMQEELQELVKEHGREKVEHHIIELNEEVFKKLLEFQAQEEKLGRATVVPHQGSWQDVVEDLKKANTTYSGILYDPFPTCKEEQHFHQLMFISDQSAGALLQKNGTFVYCNLTSLGVLLAENNADWKQVWEVTQKPYLNGQEFEVLGKKYTIAGLTNSEYSLFEVTEDMKAKRAEQKCNYYGGDIHNHALVPVCVRK